MEKLQKDLLDAVSIGYTGYVRELLSEGLDPNFHDEGGLDYTPLGYAVFDRNIEMVQLLLSLGAKITTEVQYERTPLHIAVRQQETTILRMLLNSGQPLPLDKFDELSRTPLMEAVHTHNLEHVQMLLSSGADVNARDEEFEGDTALGIAFQRCDLDMVKLLLKHGADLYAIGFVGRYVLWEIRNRQGKTAEQIRSYLLERYPPTKEYLSPSTKKRKKNNPYSLQKVAGSSVWTYSYGTGRMVVQTPLGGVVTQTLNSLGLVETVTNLTGSSATFLYDSRGFEISRANPLNQQITTSYNSSEIPVQTMNALGFVTTYVRDAYNNAIAIQQSDGSVTSYVYGYVGSSFDVTGSKRRVQAVVNLWVRVSAYHFGGQYKEKMHWNKYPINNQENALPYIHWDAVC
jgi:hypothetical protein